MSNPVLASCRYCAPNRATTLYCQRTHQPPFVSPCLRQSTSTTHRSCLRQSTSSTHPPPTARNLPHTCVTQRCQPFSQAYLIPRLFPPHLTPTHHRNKFSYLSLFTYLHEHKLQSITVRHKLRKMLLFVCYINQHVLFVDVMQYSLTSLYSFNRY